MALTLKLSQISTTQAPGVGFYVILESESTGMVYDGSVQQFVVSRLAPGTKLAMTEATRGAGDWELTLDASGFQDGFYKVYAYESSQNLRAAEVSTVYLVGGSTGEDLAAQQVALDHNTGGANALAYVAPNGQPIVSATVRVYTSEAWNSRALQNPLGITVTDTNGAWVNPIFVPRGATYYVQFMLPGKFGPNEVRVTV